MGKPTIIDAIERNYELTFSRIALVVSTEKTRTAQLKDFMRYGGKDDAPYKYLLDEDQIIGLYLRSNSKIETFSFLEDPALAGLEALNLSENGLQNLILPSTLQRLTYLDISDNKALKSLTFECALAALQTLEGSDSGLLKITFPNGFNQLERIDISRNNKLAECEILGNMPNLTTLDLSGNKLTAFTLSDNFERLRFLYLKDNKKLKSLKLPKVLPALEVLHLVDTQLDYLPATTILDSPLLALYASGNAPKNIPKLFLKGSAYTATNCLSTALIWFQELRDNADTNEANDVIKLMITGNGNVGKTTIVCALDSLEKQCVCVKTHPSTHGVQMGTYAIKDALKMNYWDFGGQEVYHGTHRLFLSTAAVQLIVFDPNNEAAAQENEPIVDRLNPDELIYNRPIQYFYDINHELSKDSQFLFVQNKKSLKPKAYPIVKNYAAGKGDFLQVDARKGIGMRGLNDAIEKAAKSLPDYGMVMPKSWLEVRQFFIDNINEDQPVKNRKRIIKKAFYKQLCVEKGVNKATWDLLLDYLHHSGFIYKNEKLGEDIIADQRWALDAIYQPLTRGTAHYKAFKRREGKISIAELFNVFGNEYEREHKWLFVSFMASCGLCFKLNTSDSSEAERSDDDIYLFPEFLAAEEPEDSLYIWNEKVAAVHIYRHRLSWANYYIIHSFICAVGRKTNTKNIWRNGIHIVTKEGCFKVALEVVSPKEVYLKLFIEASAEAKWLILVLTDFKGKYSLDGWEVSADLGLSFLKFDAEKWKNRLEHDASEVMEAGATSQNNILKESLADELSDSPQNIAQTPITRGVLSKKQFRSSKAPYMGSDTVIVGKKKTRILFLSANPIDQKRLQTGLEHRKIREELKLGKGSKKFKFLDPAPAVTINGLLRAMSQEPHIIHFSGHGMQKGIYVATEENKADLIKMDALKHLFDLVQSTAKCVILNSCYSAEQAKMISEFGMFVIGYNLPVEDKAAIAFATGFYTALGGGKKDIRAAFKGALFTWSCQGAQSTDIIEVWKDGQLIDL